MLTCGIGTALPLARHSVLQAIFQTRTAIGSDRLSTHPQNAFDQLAQRLPAGSF